MKNGIVLIDPRMERRHAVHQRLLAAGFHVEPFENAEAFLAYPIMFTRIVIADEGDALINLGEALDEFEFFPSTLAYGDILDPARIVASVKTGASDYVFLPDGLDNLAAKVAALSEPETNVLKVRAKIRHAQRSLKCLTRRERDVVELIACGLSNKAVAAELRISPRTVEIHRANVIKKMRQGSIVGVLRIVFESRFDEVPELERLAA